MEIKNCKTCIFNRKYIDCQLKEKYKDYKLEMEGLIEKYGDEGSEYYGFSLDCPSYEKETKVVNLFRNASKSCEVKPVDTIISGIIKDGGTIKEPYTVTYINREDTKEEIDKKLKEILGLGKGESKGNITLNNDGTVTFNNSSEIKTIPSNENNRGKRAERIGYLNLNNNNFQDNKELLDIIMSLLLS